MRPIMLLLFVTCLFSCNNSKEPLIFSEIRVDDVYTDSVSIRAIEFLDDNTLAFAGSNGIYGTVDVLSGKVRTNVMQYDSLTPEFRAVAHTSSDFFMLSIANPALLYKTGDEGRMNLVYKEEGETVFYDAMKFWNDKEGIAVGDTVGGCLSIIITRDGGKSWSKLSCDVLPASVDEEGAFAASNTNIEIVGDSTLLATTAGRIYFSGDKGVHWKVIETPMQNSGPTRGIYSIDFYDAKTGFAIGGDYTKPEENNKNKMFTNDGGYKWELTADGAPPVYKSCVQYVPGSSAKGLVAVGFTGISYSNDGGKSWRQLSDESFYTIRFLNDKVAYAAGKNRISKLVFN
ncbi:oxidoreductase [Maribacter sp. MMG018]|uniref:WD40/YVTN/BNR-like repeat-containing protein n=1 Tax=Maribacter sp. MMG018 TaxID=2822688 RepID=UPI001B39CC2A|nr:oxidoreductase [Maribacter sp. MMG018]MBQ4914809.1 oxidoreductase [Maribacter sp. MMG018]